MNRLLLLCLFGVSIAAAQFTPTTIVDIQKVPNDSLKLADSLGIGANAKWTLQVSPMNGQLVEVTALVAVPPNYITYTAGGRTMVLIDTGAAATAPFSGILVRYPGTVESFDANGYNSIQKGNIITIKGKISEFPLSSMNSLTQFEPDTNEAVLIVDNANHPIPAPPLKSVADFNVGANPGGKVMISTGEQFESRQVMFTNLTVTAIVNAARGTWAATDESGNTISMYDWSHFFTIGHGTINIPGDSSYKVPPVGSKIDTLRGYIATSSGGEATRGFRICPIFKGDVVYGTTILPAITTHRRNPVVPSKDSNVVISAKVYRVTSGIGNGALIDTVTVLYRVNNGAWQTVGMSAPQVNVDSTYYGTIPKQAAGSTVQYFLKVRDKASLVTTLANSATLVQFDTSKGTFFYKSLDRAAQPVLTIRDVQYTPYINGRTPYLGAVDSVAGIITADTSSLRISALTTAGTNAWYMQSGNQPYSGIWISGPDSIMTKLRNGDSVVVKGNISETNEVTRITNITSARVVSTGRPLPAPVVLKTTVFGPGATNGTFAAEQYEGMLVRFDTVVVTDVSPVFDQPTEFEISNGGQAVLVRRDGRHTYSNVPADTTVGMTILRAGNKIASLTGVIFYNNNRYKFVPRSNADFVGVSLTGVRREQAVATAYGLEQNYPNPFNPATTIRYSIPQAGAVTLKVFNVIGQEVATLVNERQERGIYSVKFDASRLASGLYLYRVTAGDFVQVKKMMLLK